MKKIVFLILSFSALCFGQYDYQKGKCSGVMYKLKKLSNGWKCRHVIQTHKRKDFYCLNGFSRDINASSDSKTCRKPKSSSNIVTFPCPGASFSNTKKTKYIKCDKEEKIEKTTTISTPSFVGLNTSNAKYELDTANYNKLKNSKEIITNKSSCSLKSSTTSGYNGPKNRTPTLGINGGVPYCAYEQSGVVVRYKSYKDKYKSCKILGKVFECIKK